MERNDKDLPPTIILIEPARIEDIPKFLAKAMEEMDKKLLKDAQSRGDLYTSI